MFLDDIVKIHFSEAGYLPQYRPAQISDKEMCDAFLSYPNSKYVDSAGVVHTRTDDERWELYLNDASPSVFKDNYSVQSIVGFSSAEPDVQSVLTSAYRVLVEGLVHQLDTYKASVDDNKVLPNWVYSYMLCSTLTYTSPTLELHDLQSLMNTQKHSDVFDTVTALNCYECSKVWVSRHAQRGARCPTIFGEPHVLKYLRLKSAAV